MDNRTGFRRKGHAYLADQARSALGITGEELIDILGLEKGARPNFAFPGAWMYSEGKAVVHLVDISKTDEPQKPDSGVVHHVAFASTGFAGMQQRLKSKAMEFDSRQVPGGDLWQIFVDDPNGVMIELNYEAAKEQSVSAPKETRADIGTKLAS